MSGFAPLALLGILHVAADWGHMLLLKLDEPIPPTALHYRLHPPLPPLERLVDIKTGEQGKEELAL